MLNNTNFRSSDSEDLDDLDSEGFTGRTNDIFGEVVPDPVSHPIIDKYKKMTLTANNDTFLNGYDAYGTPSPLVPFGKSYIVNPFYRIKLPNYEIEFTVKIYILLAVVGM